MEIAAQYFRPPSDFAQRVKVLRNRLGLTREQFDPAKLGTTHQILDTTGDNFDAKTADEEERTGDG